MRQSFINLGLVIGIAIFLNILGQRFYSFLDLTEEKRFTLTQPTEELLESLDDIVYVQILLDGEFPAGFKRLQKATREILDDFRSISSYVEYEFDDPSDPSLSVEEVNARREQLRKDGIRAKNLLIQGGEERKQLLFYPYAIVNYKGRNIPVDLLGENIPGRSSEEEINEAVGLLEYKFANAIKKLQTTRKPVIAFTKGHGELAPLQLKDLISTLLPYYNFGYMDLDSTVQISPEISMLIIAKPRLPFSDKDKFKIDQYVMNGGKMIWLMDALDVHLDSLRRTASYVPLPYSDDLMNLEDLLFKYGARINNSLALDLQCSPIPQVVDERGTQSLVPWYYHLIAVPNQTHPMTKGLAPVNLLFANTVDTVRTKTGVQKSFVLNSSERSRIQFFPMRLNFEILKIEPDPAKFDKPNLPIGVLLEGVFPSNYENRPTGDFLSTYQQLGFEYKTQSVPTKMLVIADGDLIKNPIDPVNENYGPLGYNRYANFTFGNKDFLINAIEYLTDEQGVITSRSKEVKLRLLNTSKAKEEKSKWQLINILIPIIFLAVFGVIYNFVRRRRFARN